MKYLLKFIFPFLRSGTEDKRGVEFCHSTRDASRFGRTWGTECLNTRFSLPTLQCAGYSVKLKLHQVVRPVVARGTKCDCKTDWLWVRSPLEELKYLLKFIFLFLRSGGEVERGIEFCHSTRNASRIRQNVGNGVS